MVESRPGCSIFLACGESRTTFAILKHECPTRYRATTVPHQRPAVSNLSNQIFLKRPRLLLPCLGVLVLLLSGAFLWPARSGAARRISSNSAQSLPSKRCRPEFVARSE